MSFVAVAAIHLAVPTGAAAADCASQPPLEMALAQTSVAFVGEVVEAQFGSIDARIRVAWIWKGGDLPEEVAVVAPNNSEVSFRVGASYIVIPMDTKAPFELSQCSGTRIYRASGETIPDELQAAVGSVSGLATRPGDFGKSSDSGSRSGWVPIVLAGGVAVAAFALFRLISRGGRRELSPTGTVSGAEGAGWRGVGGPLSWSARSGDRQLRRMRRVRKSQHEDTED